METTTNHKEIDFLPQFYREQSKRRQTKASRYVVIGLFASLLLTATFWQWQLKRNYQRQLETVRPMAASTTQQQALLATDNARLAALESRARLYSLLAHRWPTTQLLAAILQDVPRDVQFTELTLRHGQTGPPRGFNTNTTGGEAEPAEQPQLAPPVEDFQQVVALAEAQRVIIQMEGRTSNTAQLHRFVGQVASSPLIDKAVLESLEADLDSPGQVPGVASFRIRIVASDSLVKPRSLLLQTTGGLAARSGP